MICSFPVTPPQTPIPSPLAPLPLWGCSSTHSPPHTYLPVLTFPYTRVWSFYRTKDLPSHWCQIRPSFATYVAGVLAPCMYTQTHIHVCLGRARPWVLSSAPDTSLLMTEWKNHIFQLCLSYRIPSSNVYFFLSVLILILYYMKRKKFMCTWVLMPTETRRGQWIPWSWSYRALWAAQRGPQDPSSGLLQWQHALLILLSHLSRPQCIYSPSNQNSMDLLCIVLFHESIGRLKKILQKWKKLFCLWFSLQTLVSCEEKKQRWLHVTVILLHQRYLVTTFIPRCPLLLEKKKTLL